MRAVGNFLHSEWMNLCQRTRSAWEAVVAFCRQRENRHRLVIIGAGLLVLSYALSVLGYVLFTQELGIRSAFARTVNHFYPEFLYPKNQREELRAGDTIVALGGQHIDNWSKLLRRLDELRNISAEPGDTKALDDPERNTMSLDGHQLVRIQFTRDDDLTVRSVWCALGPPPLETLVPSVLWFFLKSGLFVVGALVYWKRGEDRAAAQFFCLCIVSLGAYIGGYHWWRIVTQPLLLLGFVVSAVLLPAVALHFYLLFPRPKALLERFPRRVLAVVYGPPVLFLLLLMSGYLRIRLSSPQAMDPLLHEMVYEILTYFGVALVWYLASVVCLIHSLRTAAGTTERNQVKWILFGSAAALVPIVYSVYLAYMQQGRFGGGAATWPMFAASACVTLAFTISITRYRLLQLDQIISSGVVYFVISSLVGLIYYGLVFGVVLVGRRGGDGPSLGQALGAACAAMVLLVILDVARGRFKVVLARHFRREKYQLDRTLLRMRQAIEQLVDPPALAKRLLQTSAELLGVPSGAVYIRRGSPPLYHLADSLGPPPGLTELSSGCPVVEALAARGGLWLADRFTPDPVRRQLHLLGGEVAQALTHEGQLLGLLVLGPKGDGDYGPEDLTLLTAFAQLSVPALVSAEGHRTIETLNRDLQTKVEKIAEQQRRILALQNQLQSGVRSQGSGLRGQESGARGHETGDRSQEPGHGAGGAAPPPTSDSRVVPTICGVVGSSPQVRQLLGLVKKVAASQSAVLLRGESGTGKEVLARALHENSPRAAQPFIKVHCAALAPGLLESELFGHVKGAFTSALRDKPGRFEAAHGGTLFLDEIGDIALEVQTKLLRVLQEMTLERVGSNEPIKVDVRIIAATHQDLESLIRLGRFREDLFYRLNVFPIRVPPLRERVEDIPELAQHFLRLYGRRPEAPVTTVDDDALTALKAYHWPGNVRQLENVIERAVVIAEGPVITPNELPLELLETSGLPAGDEDGVRGIWTPTNGHGGTLAELAGVMRVEQSERARREREHLVRALAAANGNKAEAARALGMARSTLVSRLKRLGLS
jgi:transcriptional regulator with GAF, ATPase, and Fis domain